MDFSKTVLASSLGSGVVEVPTLGVAVKSATGGDISIRYSNNTAFSTVTVPADNLFYPIGTFKEIDLAVAPADLEIGITF